MLIVFRVYKCNFAVKFRGSTTIFAVVKLKMNDAQKEALRKSLPFLCENLRIKEVVTILYSKNILTNLDRQEIQVVIFSLKIFKWFSL